MAKAKTKKTKKPARIATGTRAFGSFGEMKEERGKNDMYETPPLAVDMLFSNQRFGLGGIWDPSAGRGAILQAIKTADPARDVMGTDLHKYTRLPGTATAGMISGKDFLETLTMPGIARHIVMNPPYADAEKHVRHALGLIKTSGVVASLMRLNFIAAKKRKDLLPFLHKVVICGRLKMLPMGVEDKGFSGSVDFAWFIFGTKVVDSTIIVRA